MTFYHNTMKQFLIVVSEHRSRLERQTRRDTDIINQLKRGIIVCSDHTTSHFLNVCLSLLVGKESVERERELLGQLREQSDEASRKHALLSKQHTTLQV